MVHEGDHRLRETRDDVSRHRSQGEAIDEQVARMVESLNGISEEIADPSPELDGELPHLPAPGKLRQAG